MSTAHNRWRKELFRGNTGFVVDLLGDPHSADKLHEIRLRNDLIPRNNAPFALLEQWREFHLRHKDESLIGDADFRNH